MPKNQNGWPRPPTVDGPGRKTLIVTFCGLVIIGKIRNSCNMGMKDLPDMYGQSLRPKGMHIRQIINAHVTTVCNT